MSNSYVLRRLPSKPMYAVVPKAKMDANGLEILLHSAVLLMQGSNVPDSAVDVVRKASANYPHGFPHRELKRFFPSPFNFFQRLFPQGVIEIDSAPNEDGKIDPAFVRIYPSAGGNLVVSLNDFPPTSRGGDVSVGAQDNLKGVFGTYWVNSPYGDFRFPMDGTLFPPLTFTELTQFIASHAENYLAYVYAGEKNFRSSPLGQWDIDFAQRINSGYGFCCKAEITKTQNGLLVSSLRLGLEPLTCGRIVSPGLNGLSGPIPLRSLPVGVQKFDAFNPDQYGHFYADAVQSLQLDIQ